MSWIKKLKNQVCHKNVGKLINNNFMFASLACKNTDLIGNQTWIRLVFRVFSICCWKVIRTKISQSKTHDLTTIRLSSLRSSAKKQVQWQYYCTNVHKLHKKYFHLKLSWPFSGLLWPFMNALRIRHWVTN